MGKFSPKIPRGSGRVGNPLNFYVSKPHLWTSGKRRDPVFCDQIALIVHTLDDNYFCDKPHDIEGYHTPLWGAPRVKVTNSPPSPRAFKKKYQPRFSYHPNVKWSETPKSWRVRAVKKMFACQGESTCAGVCEYDDDQKDYRRNTYAKRKHNAVKADRKADKKRHVKFFNKIAKHQRRFQNQGIFRDTRDCVSGVSAATSLMRTFHETMDSFKYDKTNKEENVAESIIGRIEDLVALATGLACAQNFGSVVTTLYFYCRTHYTKSVSKLVMQWLVDALFRGVSDEDRRNAEEVIHADPNVPSKAKNIFDTFDKNPPTEKAWGGKAVNFTNQGREDVLEGMRNMIDFNATIGDWLSFVKDSLFARNVGNVINILVTLGFCENLKENPMTLGNYELFEAKSWDIKKDCHSFLGAVLETFDFFLQRGYSALFHNDPSLLLYDDDEARSYDSEYAMLVSCLPLIEAGKLAHLRDAQGFENETDYEIRAHKLVDKTRIMIKSEKAGPRRTVLTNNLVQLNRVVVALTLAHKNMPIRKKPFAFLIYGGSGVCKSMLTNIFMKVILSANGKACGKHNIVTVKDNEDFDTDQKHYHTGWVYDDFGNTKPKHYKGNPVDSIITVVNNMPRSMRKAELAEKGVCMMEPDVVGLNTNVPNIHATEYSEEPASVLRRFEIHCTARLRPEFTDAATGGPIKERMNSSWCPDAWLIDVYRVRIVRAEQDGNAHQPDSWRFDNLLEGASVYQVRDLLVKLSRKHFEEQEAFVENMVTMYDMEFCRHGCPSEECKICSVDVESMRPTKKIESDEEEEIVFTKDDYEEFQVLDMDNFIDSIVHRRLGDVPTYREEFNDWADKAIDLLNTLLVEWAEDLDCVKQCMQLVTRLSSAKEGTFSNQGISEWVCNPLQRQKNDDDLHFFDAFENHDHQPYQELAAAKAEPQSVRYLKEVVFGHTNPIMDFGEYLSKNLVSADEEARHKHVEFVLGTLGVTTVGIIAYKAFMSMYRATEIFSVQEAVVDPNNPPRPPVPFPTDKDNPWKTVPLTEIPKSDPSKTATLTQLNRLVGEKLSWFTVENEEGVKRQCGIFPVMENVWILPRHMMSKGLMKCSVHNVPEGHAGLRTNFTLTEDFYEPVGTTDLVLVRIISGGSQKNMVDFFPTSDWEHKGGLFVDVSHVDRDCKLTRFTTKVTSKGPLTTEFGPIEAIQYEYEGGTKPGICMSTLVTHQSRPAIIGFHVAGIPGKTSAAAAAVNQDMINVAMQNLNRKIDFRVHSSGTFPTESLGIKFPIKPVIPEHHPAHFTQSVGESHPQFVAYGSHPQGTVTFRSNVKKSVISDSVSKHLGLPRVHGPPAKRSPTFDFQRELQQMATVNSNLDVNVLLKSFQDLRHLFFTYLDERPKLKEHVHPYDHVTIINGAPGIACVDRMNPKTSAGFPMNSPKSDFLGDPEFEDNFVAYDWKDPQVQKEIDQMEQTLLSGERVNTIFRATLKDEAVAFDKKKRRVFAGSSMQFTYLVRKYFLPIVRIIQMSNGDLESAVGIDATSPGWTNFAKKMTKFDANRCFAGDYKAFDKNVSMLITRMGMQVLIDVAEYCGYSEEYLTVMRGIASEICQPNYEYAGVFLQLFGSMPSGHPLTVILNNLNNSLYLRYVYYTLHGVDHPVQFSDVVSLLCYGDDNNGNVSPKELLFNHKTISEVLDTIGVTYTMADKESESVPFIPISEVSFLKRNYVWNEEAQNYFAPLEEKSISKSLHNYMNTKSDTLPDQIAAQVIEGANREFFMHGRDVFEKRREQLTLVIEECGLSGFIPRLQTWDELMKWYLAKPHAMASAVDFEDQHRLLDPNDTTSADRALLDSCRTPSNQSPGLGMIHEQETAC